MRILKSLLVGLIGLTALMYAIQNLADVGTISQQVGERHENWLAARWIGFALVILCQLAIAAVAMKGSRDLFAARNGIPDEFKEAKSAAVWAGGLSLLLWFILSLLVGSGLFQGGTESGAAALSKAFALGTTSAQTVLFVWGTRD